MQEMKFIQQSQYRLMGIFDDRTAFIKQSLSPDSMFAKAGLLVQINPGL